MNEEQLDQIQSDLEDSNIKDVKINPDFYTHLCYINAIKSLERDDINTGLVKFRIIIETLETLTKARGLLDNEDYKDKLDKFIEKLKKSKDMKDITMQGKIANHKLQLLSEVLFKSKINTSPLQDK